MIGKIDQIITALAKVTNALHTPNFDQAYKSFLKDMIYFDHAVTLAYYQEKQPIILHKVYSDDVTEESLVEYIRRAYLLDPVYSAHLNQIEPGCYKLLDEIAPDRFKNTPYFETYYQETDISDEVVFITYTETGYTLVLSLFRLLDYDDRLTKKEFNHLKLIAPMLLALMKQQWNNFSDSRLHLEEESDPLKIRIQTAIEKKEGLSLTDRQAEIIALTLRGHSATSIGLLLEISADTVKVHRRNIYNRLRISSQAELFSLVISAIGPLTETKK
ncbi:LuxR C-terminal-related transcriptional regulator [Curvivirga aplysinae]|uniref:LuxR C-terminal-related transcriptional regulator n=1 Tax=Curvivirga aplysinae TaxID=2529852 RepID=UPI0012BCD74E|nr:LuxR C-terminal-related transcriptional regulator [Curvivirga aplysinae]MTI10871.1 hypothetical protein [Curvivirga aplysinae]